MRLCLSLLVLICAIAQLPAADHGKIGVIHLDIIFKGAQFIEKSSTGLQSQAKIVNEQVEAILTEIKNIETEMSTYDPKNPEDWGKYHELKQKSEVLKLQRKLYFERHRVRLDQAEMDLLRASYIKIRETLGQFAEEKGFDLILLGSRAEVASRSLTEFRIELATHSVQYQKQSMDITEEFLAFLNNRVQAELEGTGSSPAINLDDEKKEKATESEKAEAEKTDATENGPGDADKTP